MPGENTEAEVQHELDARGLRCPLPVLRAKRALGGMEVGERLQVVTADPDAVRDFERFCQLKGHALCRHWEAAGVFHFIIERGAGASHGP